MVLPLIPNEGSTAPQAYPFININTLKEVNGYVED
jgi:hypothetical protein